MAFIIQTHGRLHEWVADEKGYFTDEGLDYEFRTLMPARWSCEKTTDEAPEEVIYQHPRFVTLIDPPAIDTVTQLYR